MSCKLSSSELIQLLALPVPLLHFLHQFISGKLPPDHHDQVLDDIFRTVYIQQASDHNWQSAGVHLRTETENPE